MLSEIIWNEKTLGVVFVFAIPIVAIICTFWFKIEKARSENDLKRRMIERGMSAEEMERVLAAKASEVQE